MEWNLREIFVFMKLLDRHRKEIKKLGGYVQWGNYLSITFRKRNKNEHQCAKLYKSFVKEFTERERKGIIAYTLHYYELLNHLNIRFIHDIFKQAQEDSGFTFDDAGELISDASSYYSEKEGKSRKRKTPTKETHRKREFIEEMRIDKRVEERKKAKRVKMKEKEKEKKEQRELAYMIEQENKEKKKKKALPSRNRINLKKWTRKKINFDFLLRSRQHHSDVLQRQRLLCSLNNTTNDQSQLSRFGFIAQVDSPSKKTICVNMETDFGDPADIQAFQKLNNTITQISRKYGKPDSSVLEIFQNLGYNLKKLKQRFPIADQHQ